MVISSVIYQHVVSKWHTGNRQTDHTESDDLIQTSTAPHVQALSIKRQH